MINKEVALVTLIQSSIIFSDEDKLDLINKVPSYTDRQVEQLGKFLATERQFVLDHEKDIRGHLDTLLTELEKPENEKVFVGTGKPS